MKIYPIIVSMLLTLGLACATPPMTYSEYRNSDLQSRTLVYVSVYCSEAMVMNLSPAVRGEGNAIIDCKPGKVHRLSFPLGEGVYVLTGEIEQTDSFRWVNNLFVVPKGSTNAPVYWGRINAARIDRGVAVVLIQEDPADLKRITEESGLSDKQISREWTVENGE